MNIIALLTGRGNNTLPNKNIIPINGKPLLYYPATEAKKCWEIIDYYVTSDDDKILKEASDLGYKKIKRPVEYAQPDSQISDCIVHALEIMNTPGNRWMTNPIEILVVLLANSATIKSKWISDCISMIKQNPEISAAIPVKQDNDHHPYRSKRINDDGFLDVWGNSKNQGTSQNRQDLEPNFFPCHNFWVLNVDKCFGVDDQPPFNFMGNKVKPYIVDYSLDVHYEEDIYLTELWVNRERKNEL
jgi:N-acylneuraminate cytidylyltransferase